MKGSSKAVSAGEISSSSFETEETSAFVEALTVGHQPSVHLPPKEAELFRAFQSNLLSLISHELRTPLMGVLNALTLLDEGAQGPEISQAEMIHMARSNAQRLHRALVTLLDLASIDSGTFHARLREVDLPRLVKNRLQVHQKEFKGRGIRIKDESLERAGAVAILADPQKLSRAVDLCLELIAGRAASGSVLEVSLESEGDLRLGMDFVIAQEVESSWDSAWSQGVAGFESGVGAPTSAFRGVFGTEEAFLTRPEEGLGSEFLLIHQIMQLHQGRFEAARKEQGVRLRLTAAPLRSESAVRAVLMSRAYEVSTELGSVALALIRVSQSQNVENFCTQVKKSLFRATDAAYAVPELRRVALVLDDCKAEDAPRLLKRLEAALGKKLEFGIAHCPEDGIDPSILFDLAESRLSQ